MLVQGVARRDTETVKDKEVPEVRAPEEDRSPKKMKRQRAKSKSRTPEPSSREGVAAAVGGEKPVKKRRPTLVSTSAVPMTAARTLPLLVCSVGNPGSTYANTLHSAGHTVLNRLAEHLGYNGFRKERDFGNGLLSRPAMTGSTGDWTLWQSTSYMNESGKGVRAAYTAWAKTIPVGEEGKLVVVYDELEKPLGVVTVRTQQGASAKGHNGLKSIMSVMGSIPFARIGVGIGRPVSRESDEVARYVLKKMAPAEKTSIEGSIEEIVKKLKQLEKG